ncbi:IS3 family transposase [Limosilactobacillus agrestis]
MENSFPLYKTELLAGIPSCKNISELMEFSQDYTQYFNMLGQLKKQKV